MNLTSQNLLELYERLYSTYGPQHWWPADTAFEVMVGAVLTQNTAWTNVEKAITVLKANNSLSLERLHTLDRDELATMIRPAGYFNVKAGRLYNLCAWLVQQGGVEQLCTLPDKQLRTGLLSVNGIGPETADDILLYACNRPVFVIDAYTRRLFSRMGWMQGDEDYEHLRAGIERALGPDTGVYNEYHALIVRHAKERCANNTDCLHCQVEEPFHV